MYRIGIDPGHGGSDPGAQGPAGLKEKDVTLAISLKLDRLLKAAGLDTYITRPDDRTMELITRSALINNMKCDLAISVHINSATASASYVSTFIQGTGGEAEKLAKKVQAELVQATGWPDGGVRVKNLHMTRETRMPAILVECGFISNPEQEKMLKRPETIRLLSQAIVDGILDYVDMKGEEYMNSIFKDVDPNRWSYPDIVRCVDTGIITGYPDGTFKPNNNVTREELASIASRITFQACIVGRDLVRKVLNSTITILRNDGGMGTGFFIGPEYVITNNHVVEGSNSLAAISDNNKLHNQPLTVLGNNAEYDLALIKCPVTNDDYLSVYKGELYQGQHVAVIGSPKGYSYNWSQGVITNPRRSDNPAQDPNLISTDAAINPGNSGGPVINGRGEVVGVVRSKFVALNVEGMGFAVRSEFLRAFCKKNGVIV